MKRNKLTDFILNYFKWTGVFLYEQIYWSRLNKVLTDIKLNNFSIDSILPNNDDVINTITNIDNKYKIEVK